MLYYGQDQRKAKSKSILQKGGRQAWVSPISLPDSSSRSWTRPGALELQRSDLAQRFNCVPSQINYVMSTRFSPEHGYIVESRRGGGGYIRITRVQVDRQTLLMHVINTIGDTLDYASARAITQNLVDSEAISRELGQSMLAATGERALRSVAKEQRSGLRADIFKQILIHSV